MQDGSNVSDLLQCVQTVAKVVSENKQTMTTYVRTQMEFVKTFQSQTESERVETVNQISFIKPNKIPTVDGSVKCNADMFAIPGNTQSITSQVPLKLNELENFSLLSQSEKTLYIDLLIQERKKCISVACNSSLNSALNSTYGRCVYLNELIKQKAKDIYYQNVFKDATKICAKPSTQVAPSPISNIAQQCVDTAFSIVLEKKQTMKSYVATKMESVSSFQVSSADTKVKIVDNISKVPNVTYTKKDILPDMLTKCNSELGAISRPLFTSSPIRFVLISIPEFSRLNVDQQKEQIIIGMNAIQSSSNPISNISKYCNDLQQALKTVGTVGNSDDIKKTLGVICKPISTSQPITPVNPTNPNTLQPIIPVNPSTPTGLPNGITNNQNAGQPGQGNIMIAGSESYGKCALLNKIVFDSYNDYLIAVRLQD